MDLKDLDERTSMVKFSKVNKLCDGNLSPESVLTPNKKIGYAMCIQILN